MIDILQVQELQEINSLIKGALFLGIVFIIIPSILYKIQNKEVNNA